MKKEQEMKAYVAPQVEVIEVEVENGYAVSGNDPEDVTFGGDLSGN